MTVGNLYRYNSDIIIIIIIIIVIILIIIIHILYIGISRLITMQAETFERDYQCQK